MTINLENFDPKNQKLLNAERLGNALFIEYGDDKDSTSELKIQNLALDMVDIVSKNPKTNDTELLALVKQCDGYQKLILKTTFNDAGIRLHANNNVNKTRILN